MKKLLLLSAIVLSFSGLAKAGVLVEPYAGFETGKTTGSGTITGSPYGLRVAYSIPMFWAGIDATMGTVTYKDGAGNESKPNRTLLSGVVGVNLPILFRVWIGAGFSDTLKFSSVKDEGTSTKFGIGIKPLPLIPLSINLEKLNETFTKADGVTMPDFKNDSYVLSLSFPIDL